MFKKILLLIAVTFSINLMAGEVKWRGLLPLDKQFPLVLGLNIDESSNTLTLDSPLQGMFSRKPSNFELNGSLVKFEDEALDVTFSGEIINDVLVGTFNQKKKTVEVTLQPLSTERLNIAKMEGIWKGDLAVGGDTVLPLEFNLAVLADDLLGSLNSPAQEAYGIPLENVVMDAKQLSFESKIIGANYSGGYKEGGYQGVFNQGYAFPLTLKKDVQ